MSRGTASKGCDANRKILERRAPTIKFRTYARLTYHQSNLAANASARGVHISSSKTTIF